ncbi:MAG: EamA family transporter, partial [Nanoarchaeota archaeon]
VLLFFAVIALMKTFKHKEISQVVPLKNLSIITIALFGFLFLGEVASIYAYLGITLILIGTYFVEMNPSLEHPLKPIHLFKDKYSSLIILYLILIGFVAILDKTIVQVIDPYTFLFFTFLFLMIISWIMQIIFYKAIKNFKHTLKNSIGLFFFAGLFTIISDLFYLKAIEMPLVMITLAVPLKRTATLLTTIMGGKMFKEKHLLIRIVGCIIMIIGVTLIIM